MEKRIYSQNNEPFSGDGAALIKMFDPRVMLGEEYPHDQIRGVSTDFLATLATEARKHLFSECQRGCCPHDVANNQGRFEISGKAAEAMRATGGAVASLVAYPDAVQLPGTKQERQAFSKTLINAALHHDGEHHIIAPVCPDYGKGETFYRGMGGGISPEARAAINGAKILAGSYSDFLSPKVTILVADTEDDIQEIINNTSSGETPIYKAHCEASAQAIRDELADIPQVQVQTFSQFLGADFRSLQLKGEVVIQHALQDNEQVRARVTGVAEQRIARHSQILARPESSYELTIRYMAQYMALGELARRETVPTVLMNYQTPNREFYNAATHIHHDLHFSERSGEVIPVLGTFAKR